MKNNYKEIKINFGNKFYFTHCGITVRDFGHHISIADSGARNGIIAFSVNENAELADKIRSNTLSMNDNILVEAGATFISPEGEKTRTTERYLLIPSKYDYNFRIKFDDGCLCPISEIDLKHSLFDSMRQDRMFNCFNSWESYMSRFSRGGSGKEAAVFAEGQQFYISVDWSTEWQDGRPHVEINGLQYVYDSFDGWRARHNEFNILYTNDGLMEFLDMFIEEDRRRRS